ncbi:GNAT family N-acetyltransferase [Azotobacter vinelandii]|uniref:GNAT family N-acetyltransferase n=1 Tax=Azotobacter vinelandii TaxID=354 RepID=UPI000774AABF|nr:GNAT family N-acetyltransferase [Azotobacter vinelandii]
MNSPAILRDIPRELRTERLTLRCPREGDGIRVHEAVVESLAALRAWPASLPWALAEPSRDASETFCRESAARFIERTMLVYLAFDPDGLFVASTSLHNIDWSIPKFEIGFWCRTSRQRQGFMTEAVRKLLDHATGELHAKRVDALTDEKNLASRAVCLSAGMRLEGVLRNERRSPTGELRNTCVYATVRDEDRSLHQANTKARMASRKRKE